MTLTEFDPQYFGLRHIESVTVVTFDMPQLTEDLNIEQLGHELFALVDQYHCRKLAVSLEGVDLLTSSVLGKMITLHRRMHRQNGQLVFCELEDGVRDVLRTSRLLTYFRVVDELEDALTALAAEV